MTADLNSEEVKPASNVQIKAKLIEMRNSANRLDLAWNFGLFENKSGLLDLEGIDLSKTVSYAEIRGVRRKRNCS